MTFRIGDHGKELIFTINAKDEPLDLSDAQKVTLYIRNGGITTEKTCSILDAANGKVYYVLEKGIIIEKGRVTFDVKVTWVDGEIKIRNLVIDQVT